MSRVIATVTIRTIRSHHPHSWLRYQRKTSTKVADILAADSKAEAINYCVSLVKLHDFDSYLSGLLLPRSCRSSYFAIRAFHVELALIKDQARRNTLTGRVRFQFWRDVLAETFVPPNEQHVVPGQLFTVLDSKLNTQQQKTPVARALRYFAEDYRPVARYFDRALDARQRELSINQFDTLDELEDFAEHSQSSLLYVLLHVLKLSDPHADEDLAHTASHVGVCTGIVTLLRSIAYHAAQGDCVIPKDVMQRHGTSARWIMAGPTSPQELLSIKECVFDVASQAFGHLEQAKVLFNKDEHSRRSMGVNVLFPVVRSQMFLEELRRADFNPFEPDLLAGLQNPGYFRYQLNLLRMQWTKKLQ